MHTPGPWVIHNCKNGRMIFPEGNGASGNVAHVYAKGEHDYKRDTYSRPEEMEANARLIATAPELLQALRILLVQKPYKDGDGAAMYHAENIARAAIAKATGGE